MVFDVKILNKADGPQQFDTFLAGHIYAAGYKPTKWDAQAFKHFKEAPDAKFEHLSRWWRQIHSFTDAERASFPEAKKGLDDSDPFGEKNEEQYEKELEKRQREGEQLTGTGVEHHGSKSTIVFDVRPCSVQTDMKAVEQVVRSINHPGLLWGASKVEELAFGVKQLLINAVVVDEVVSVEQLEEQIKHFNKYVQSVEILSFSKV